MTKLPKYFVIKRDEDDPLWQKYIDWLDDNYEANFSGHLEFYYGFSEKACCYSHLSQLDYKIQIITLEEWDEAVNGKTSFVLPEKWFIKGCKETYKWSGYNDFKPEYVDFEKHHASLNYYARNGFIQITFEQFKKYVLMKDDKKIIGYKLKDDCEKYREAACNIAGLSNAALKVSKSRKNTSFLNGNVTESSLKDAGVLDLWFEPVYAPKYSLPKINGYEGELTGYNVVKYGCVEFNLVQLSNLLEASNHLGSRSIKSITLSSDVIITMDEINQILDYLHNQ